MNDTQTTQEMIDEHVTTWVKEIADEIKAGNVDRDEPNDAIFQAVDSGWHNLGFKMGRISDWELNPGSKILILLGECLDYCEREAWLADDSGLWEGLQGSQMLGSLVFFSLENVLWKKLRAMNVID